MKICAGVLFGMLVWCDSTVRSCGLVLVQKDLARGRAFDAKLMISVSV